MNNRWLLFASMITLLQPHLSGTAYSIETLLSHPKLLAFFISEHHEMQNRQQGGNGPSIEKMVEILSRTNGEDSKIRYRVLIEYNMSNHKDLLSELIPKIIALPTVSVENIEVRKFSRAASIILEEKPTLFSHWYKEDRNREDAKEQRVLLNKGYGCKLNNITFNDVLEEFSQQRAQALVFRENWPQKLSEWPEKMQTDGISFDFIAWHDADVECLVALLKEYNINPAETIFDASDALFNHQCMQDDQYDRDEIEGSEIIHAHTRLSRIGETISRAGVHLFNFFLVNRMLQLQKKADPDERIIVLAGGAHIDTATDVLKRYGFVRAARVFNYLWVKHGNIDEGEISIHQQEALNPEQFEEVARPLAYFLEERERIQKEEQVHREIELQHQRDLELARVTLLNN